MTDLRGARSKGRRAARTVPSLMRIPRRASTVNGRRNSGRALRLTRAGFETCAPGAGSAFPGLKNAGAKLPHNPIGGRDHHHSQDARCVSRRPCAVSSGTRSVAWGKRAQAGPIENRGHPTQIFEHHQPDPPAGEIPFLRGLQSGTRAGPGGLGGQHNVKGGPSGIRNRRHNGTRNDCRPRRLRPFALRAMSTGPFPRSAGRLAGAFANPTSIRREIRRCRRD